MTASAIIRVSELDQTKNTAHLICPPDFEHTMWLTKIAVAVPPYPYACSVITDMVLKFRKFDENLGTYL